MKSSRSRAFSLLETLIAAGVTSIVLGALAVGLMSLSRTYEATRSYSNLHAGNQRLLDMLQIDLRNAVGISLITSGSTTVLQAGGRLELTTSSTLCIRQPTVFALLNTGSSAAQVQSYLTPLEIRATNSGLAYSGSTAVPPRTEVLYYRVSLGSSRQAIFRQARISGTTTGASAYSGTGKPLSIYWDSTNVDIDVSAPSSTSSTQIAVDVYFPNQLKLVTPGETGAIRSGSSRTLNRSKGVVSSDLIFLRNPREDL